jgi:hypothetical protein
VRTPLVLSPHSIEPTERSKALDALEIFVISCPRQY